MTFDSPKSDSPKSFVPYWLDFMSVSGVIIPAAPGTLSAPARAIGGIAWLPWPGRIVRVALLAVTALVLVPSEALAVKPIDIEYAEWGYDGRAVPRMFNLLTIGVRNSTREPYEGQLRLRRQAGSTGSWTGAAIVEPVYVGPYSTRLVHFYPYLLDEADEWELRWGEAVDDSYIVERPALTGGARVILNDSELVSGVTQGLKGFRDDWFPPSVLGTDTLSCVVLDHTPRWEQVRRDAFRDWLYRGGVLHVLPGPDGIYPEMPVPELNRSDRPERFGAGRIYWQKLTRNEMTRDFVYEQIYPTAPMLTNVVDRSGRSFDIDPTSTEFIREGDTFFRSYSEWDSDGVILGQLKELVFPEHNWPLIYSASVIYLVMLFPGGLLLSRTRFDYRLNLVMLLTIVASFSFLFSHLGARGYGESTSTESVAIARALPDGRWDVHQWSSLFVTTGDRYSISQASDFTLYSTAQSIERVDGSIENGFQARLTVDMPPFTFRAFARRLQSDFGPIRVTVNRLERDEAGQLTHLSLNVDGTMPGVVRSVQLLDNGDMYDLNPALPETASGNQLLEQRPTPLAAITNLNASWRNWQSNSRRDMDRSLDRFGGWLVARDLKLRRQMDAVDFRLPAGTARLFVSVEMPELLASRNADDATVPLGRQDGRLMLSIDVNMTGATSPAVSAAGSPSATSTVNSDSANDSSTDSSE